MDPTHLSPAVYLAVSLAGAAAVMTWRYRETSTPVTLRSLVLPPLGMSTGLLMFVAPELRVPLAWALGALAFGAVVFAWPLAKSSKLTRQGASFVMQRSPAFVWILLALLGARFALRSWMEQWVSQAQTGALFFLVAFGAIVRWRVSLVREFRRLGAQPG